MNPVALNHHVRILQRLLRLDRPGVPLAGPEHHGYDVHAHLVDQAGGKHLATDIASGDLHRWTTLPVGLSSALECRKFGVW
jgi:hypothetical protein